MSKCEPEWKVLDSGIMSGQQIDWCRGCGVIRLTPRDKNKKTRYLVPKRESARRKGLIP